MSLLVCKQIAVSSTAMTLGSRYLFFFVCGQIVVSSMGMTLGVEYIFFFANKLGF